MSNYRDEYRCRDLVGGIAGRIRRLAAATGKRMTFMEVCGTHTMSISQYGLRALLPPEIRLVSGPGCPVCVTPNGYLDRAIALARLPDVIIATFGDMVRVPGSSTSLLQARASGADVRIVYSPLDAVSLAAANPDRRVVFLGVGFETTAPTVAASILAALSRSLDNYYVLSAHKTIPEAMEVLAGEAEVTVDGYICPPHVSAIIGAGAYRRLAERYGIPCVVAGFEPADILQGVEMLARQLVADKASVENQYARVVTWGGNLRAQEVLAAVFQPCDAEWRGIGVIPRSGLRISGDFARFDAAEVIPVEPEPLREHPGCRCGLILRGTLSPVDCPLFNTVCTPESPVGACMVSSEGTCAAAARYGG